MKTHKKDEKVVSLPAPEKGQVDDWCEGINKF